MMDGWIGLAAMAAPGQLSVWALPAVNCWRSPCEDLQHTYCGMEVSGRLMHPHLLRTTRSILSYLVFFRLFVVLMFSFHLK